MGGRVWVVGLDENGMGPRLGPLVVTAATFELAGYDRAKLRRRGLTVGISDSKAVSAFGHMAQAESLALAVSERLCGKVPTTPEAMLDVIGLEGFAALTSACPPKSRPQCWGEPLSLPLFGGELDAGREMLARLDRSGIRFAHLRTHVNCASYLNRAQAEGRNKLVVDLHSMERLILDARRVTPEELTAYCGMVGGLRKYQGYFGVVEKTEVTCLEEVKGASRYHVRGLGELHFEVGADDRHLPVALASMVGKYVRELCMKQINRFYARHLPDLREASGYHDPVTRAFVERVAPTRRKLNVVDSCFERQR